MFEGMEASGSTMSTTLAVDGVAVNETQKRTRARRPKVKTGCKVCKIRRVKCGEEKPECFRCLKFGMKCEGYPKLHTPHTRQIERAILPKNEVSLVAPNLTLVPNTKSKVTSLKPSPTPRHPETQLITRIKEEPHPDPPPLLPPRPSNSNHIILLPSPSSPFTPRFQDAAESRYFTLFHHQTALHLSGFYSPNLWSHIVLQASEAEPSIRHAVISIGALEMTRESLRNAGNRMGAYNAYSKTAMLRQQRVQSQTEQHHLFALQQYSKAIREMQKLIIGPERDCRTALIASLLIICFETYHGNYESAAKQIATGIRLIESRHELATPPPEIEEELVHAFNRLDIQSMGHTDPFTFAEHLVLKDSGSEKIAKMPTTFPSVLVARNYFNIIVRRAAHYGCALWQSSHQTSETDSLTRPTLSHFEESENAAEFLLLEKSRYLDEVIAWFQAFKPLFDKAQPGTNDFLTTRHLQMHYLPVYLTLTQYTSLSELTYDAYLWMFKEIVEMARIQLSSLAAMHDPTFSFDMQNVWPLFVVAKKCRDPIVRREAIRLLGEWPRREGIWDSVIASAVSRWVVKVEEEGMVGTFVEEEKRAKSVGVRLELEKGRAEVWCLIPDGGGKGGTRRRKTIIEWDFQG